MLRLGSCDKGCVCVCAGACMVCMPLSATSVLCVRFRDSYVSAVSVRKVHVVPTAHVVFGICILDVWI